MSKDEFRYPDGKTPREEANDSMKMMVIVMVLSIIGMVAFVAGAIVAAQ